MASFFLFKKNSLLEINNVKNLYKKKGFDSPKEFTFEDYSLILYKKQLVDVDNFIQDDKTFMCCIGTFIYKGLSYTDSLIQVMKDINGGCIDFNRVIGNFCIIHIRNNEIAFFVDQQNVQHLFTNNEGTFITSSFLAAMEAISGKLSINRKTCIEKLLLGYTIGYETIFNEIIHLSNYKKQNSNWNFINFPPKNIPKSDGTGIGYNAKRRAEAICEYMREIDRFHKEFKSELGLSDGYDSRTLYAAALKTWEKPIALHTHKTEGVNSHDVESETVKEIAESTGSSLTIVPTKRLSEYSEKEIDEILLDDLYFFDGRCARDMGAFSPVYTRKYKIATVNNNKLTLNGLGGEVYRRYYLDIKPMILVKQWMKVHVYPEWVDKVLDKNTFNTIHKDLCTKITNEIGFRWNKIITNFQARRYYSEIVMPDCDALNCNAHNQLVFYLTPFIEWNMTCDAYKSRNSLGICGELESAIMTYLDERVASYKSHYGYPFNKKPPFNLFIRRFVRGIMPNYLEVKRVNRIVSNKTSEVEYFISVKTKSKLLRDASEYLESLFPEIDFNILRRDYNMMPNSAFISVLFYVYRDKIME